MTFTQFGQAPQVLTHCLRQGAALSLTVKDDACLQAVFGGGSGCILKLTGGAVGVWIPLRGALQVHSNGLNRPVHTGEVLVTDSDNDIKAVGHADGCWLGVAGDRKAWEWIMADAPAQGAPLLPDLHKADHDLRHAAIAVARAGSQLELEGAMSALAHRIEDLQASLNLAIARCPGRTSARRHQVFLRLQRVRNYIGACCNQELDNETLALMANLSSCYFLRTFKAVYQETPHAYLINQRLQRARQLLHSSNLAITEVAIASGFENRCVFSRTFRSHFGITAKEARLRTNAYAKTV